MLFNEEEISSKLKLDNKTSIEKRREENLKARIKHFINVVYNVKGGASIHNFLEKGEKIVYIEKYGYFTVKKIGNEISVMSYGQQLFEALIYRFLYKVSKCQEKNERYLNKIKFEEEFKGYNYFKELYIYRNMLEKYKIYYKRNIPKSLIIDLIDKINEAFIRENPDSHSLFKYDDETNTLVFDKKKNRRK